ncbi:hypothetical protein D3Z36_12300 [Lachnospiraceae bacterium]|nr:hypothetical protein [Lachnospiraceae bacterium]
MHREEIAGERFSIPVFGTRLGAAYESTPSCRVKAYERMSCTLIRVVPPEYRSLWGFGSRRFLNYPSCSGKE